MRKLVHHILWLPAYALIGVVRIYQLTLSPDHGLARHFFRYGVCRHSPTCSQFAVEQLKAKPLPIALWRAFKRVLSCNPFTKPTENKLREVIGRL